MSYFPEDDYQNRAYHPKYDKEPKPSALGWTEGDEDELFTDVEQPKEEEQTVKKDVSAPTKACSHSKKTLLGSMDGANFYHCKNCDQYLQGEGDEDENTAPTECKHRSVATVFTDGSRKLGLCTDCDQEVDAEELKRNDPLWRNR